MRIVLNNWKWLALLAVVPLLIGAAGAGWWALGSGVAGPGNRVFVQATRGDLRIELTVAATLQAVENVDINSPVRGQSTIVEIIPEGTQVKAGDVICRLDSTEWEQKVEEATIAVEGAEGEEIWAREQLALQQSTDDAAISAAKVEVLLAELSLAEFEEGERPAALSKAKRAVEMAEIARDKAQEDYNLSRTMLTRGFVTAAEVKEKHRLFLQAEGELEEKQTDLVVLSEYKHVKQQAELSSKLKQAKLKLERSEREAKSNQTQKQSDLQAKQQTLLVHRRQLELAQEQFAACTVKAPADGMVIYSTTVEPSWRNDGPLQVGTQVFEGRLLIRLPNLARMKAVAPVSEHRIAEVRVDEENPITALVTLPGYDRSFPGRVTKKAVMPSSESFWNEDNKQYPVDVELDEMPPDAKPGASCQVTLVLQIVPDVVMIPNNCLWRRGDEAFVFVERKGAAGDLEARRVKVGAISDTHCEIIEGLAEGEAVLSLEVGQGGSLLETWGSDDSSADGNATTQTADSTDI